MSDLKITALQHAALGGGETAAVVARAAAYYAFLAGTAAPATPAAGVGKPTTAKADAPKVAEGGKPDAPKATKAADAAKADAAKADAAKASKASKADAAKAGKAGAAASAQAVPGDTKAPGGTNTYTDVVAALRKVKERTTKEDALAILKEDGGGATSVRDLKPALYDAVVEGCTNALEGEGEGGEDDPTAGPAVDELGLS